MAKMRHVAFSDFLNVGWNFYYFWRYNAICNVKLVWFNTNNGRTMAHVHVYLSSLADGRYGNHICFGRRIGNICIVQNVQSRQIDFISESLSATILLSP